MTTTNYTTGAIYEQSAEPWKNIYLPTLKHFAYYRLRLKLIILTADDTRSIQKRVLYEIKKLRLNNSRSLSLDKNRNSFFN